MIAYKYVPQYRADFFDRLRNFLAQAGVDLKLVYGDPVKSEAQKHDAVRLVWAEYARNWELVVAGKSLLFQPLLWRLKGVDLVIVEQANRLLINPLLIALSKITPLGIAYWGHGKDFQRHDGRLARAVKRWLATTVDWWFAYNETSAKAVRSTGFKPERISLVMNTIDATALAEEICAVETRDVRQYLGNLGLSGENLCVYIGGMYKEKRLPFLLEACLHIRAELNDFEMLFLGGGVDFHLVEAFCDEHDWAVCRGPTFGREKAIALKTSKLMLMPGLVGLAVIDSFAAETPIVTTNIDFHSPEIEYLVPGANGEIAAPSDSVTQYAAKVVDVLRSPTRLDILRSGCRAASQKYSMEAMVLNFGEGVLKAIREAARV